MASGMTAASLVAEFPKGVDGIALDVYNVMFYADAGGPLANGSPSPGSAATWAYLLDPPVSGHTGVGIGLTWMINFARANGLKCGVTEWGLGYSDQWRVGVGSPPGFDDGLYATNMAAPGHGERRYFRVRRHLECVRTEHTERQ